MDYWKNQLLTRLFCRFRHFQKSSAPIQRILVISTTALGDTLWATPALASLRLHYPNAHIAVLTSHVGKQILQFNPHINELYLLREPLLFHFFSLMKKLKRTHFDVALIFHASQRLVLPLCHWSHIPRIIGTVGINKGLDDLLTDPLPNQQEHEIARRLNIAMQIQALPLTHTLSYYVQNDERLKAQQFIKKTKRPCIAIHPGSKEPFRRWPAHCFATVGKALYNELNCEIFLTGSTKEMPLLKEIQEELPMARIVPSSSIRFLGAFIEQMDLVLSNDTGPFHLACALNRPTVGLYVSTDPNLCGSYKAPKAIVISKPPTCHPCLKRRCQNPFCFLQISPTEVVDACRKAFSFR